MIKKLRALTLVKNSLRTIAISGGVQRVLWYVREVPPLVVVSTELPARRRSGFIAHGVNNGRQAGKWVVKQPIGIGVCRARPFALLFANQCGPMGDFQTAVQKLVTRWRYW